MPGTSRQVVRTIIGANALWVIASVLRLLGGGVQPTVLGYVVVIGQAVAVGAFTELQLAGLRPRAGTRLSQQQT